MPLPAASPAVATDGASSPRTLPLRVGTSLMYRHVCMPCFRQLLGLPWNASLLPNINLLVHPRTLLSSSPPSSRSLRSALPRWCCLVCCLGPSCAVIAHYETTRPCDGHRITSSAPPPSPVLPYRKGNSGKVRTCATFPSSTPPRHIGDSLASK